MLDVIIIGAGVAGLSAAIELKKHRIPFLLLEAAEEAGGRAISKLLPSGTVADMGAHWFHGEHNPMKSVLEHYGIAFREDEGDALRIYKDGKAQPSQGDDWLEKMLDPEKAKHVKDGSWPDCPITELAKDEGGRQILRDFAIMWNGIDPPLEPSGKEFLTDESTPGGLQLIGGMKVLIEKFVEEIGSENIRLQTPVAAIRNIVDGIEVRAENGKTWQARYVVFTASPAVIQKRQVAFVPSIGKHVQYYLSGLAMGEMNKIIVELKEEFFEQRAVPRDMALELLDVKPPHFCHVRSAGAPLINLFVSGKQARVIEPMQPRELLEYVADVLAPVEELQGFQEHVVGDPVVSRWVGNPYIGGAYTARLPGAARSVPLMDKHVCFCGDAFEEDYPSSVTGAYLSGRAAAAMLLQTLPQREVAETN